jgi:hypothetical protein
MEKSGLSAPLSFISLVYLDATRMLALISVKRSYLPNLLSFPLRGGPRKRQRDNENGMLAGISG